jgi:hypothetical protein
MEIERNFLPEMEIERNFLPEMEIERNFLPEMEIEHNFLTEMEIECNFLPDIFVISHAFLPLSFIRIAQHGRGERERREGAGGERGETRFS